MQFQEEIYTDPQYVFDREIPLNKETLIETYNELHKELLLSKSILEKLYESKCISKKMFEKLNN